ncbi:hypothetical protein B0T24DRAFT_533027 [Lasiosphaeria ovina]|uniref:DUF6594 domain-containing protein n=1 Tax=Lasiosphaeria ovina TaxID=92902 RepID=A0AAE0N389_9PEZI|nr:hypothetical protein B0T24DRAFT_533027 [Lasiosphaeria ovina]
MAAPRQGTAPELLEGYDKLAKFIGASPEYAVFHGFKSLYAESLLYQQAEVVHLSGELNDIRIADRAAPFPRNIYHRNWTQLRGSLGSATVTGEAGDEHSPPIHGLLWLTYEGLDDSLIRYEKILRMSQPHRRKLADIYNWMTRSTLGNISITSYDRDIFKNQNEDPLVLLDPSESDTFTAWVQDHLIQTYHRFGGRYLAVRLTLLPSHRLIPNTIADIKYIYLLTLMDQQTPNTSPHLRGTVTYSEPVIKWVTRLVTVTVACAVPIGAIFALHFIVDTAARLGIVFAMSVVFALCMALMTSATTHDIFSATST